MTSQQRHTLIVALIVILLGVFGWIIVWYFSMATLTITTNSSSNTIMVRQDLNTTQNQVDVDQRGNTAHLRLSAGTYIITVKSVSQTANKIVKLGVGEHKELTMNLGDAAIKNAESEPVSSFGAASIAASKDTLRFIDRNSADHRLYSVDSSGTVNKLDPGTIYTNISWANPAFGIGYGTDKNNHYVFTKIEGNFVTHILTPFTVNVSSSAGVAPDQTWYVSDSHTIYRGNADGSFTKIYTSPQSVGILTVSNDAILLWQKAKNNRREGNLVIIHRDGEKYQIEGEAYEAAWSPSGKKLVTSGDTSELFDDKFNKIGVLPSGNFMSPVWLDDNTLLYGVNNRVMRFDLSTGEASTYISFDPVTGSPSQIKPSVDGDYVYVSIQKGGNRPELSFRLDRIPLQGQNPPTVPIHEFNLLIPNTIGGCDLNYINFAHFSIITNPVSPSTNCIPAVKEYITSYKVPLAGVSFQQPGN